MCSRLSHGAMGMSCSTPETNRSKALLRGWLHPITVVPTFTRGDVACVGGIEFVEQCPGRCEPVPLLGASKQTTQNHHRKKVCFDTPIRHPLGYSRNPFTRAASVAQQLEAFFWPRKRPLPTQPRGGGAKREQKHCGGIPERHGGSVDGLGR